LSITQQRGKKNRKVFEIEKEPVPEQERSRLAGRGRSRIRRNPKTKREQRTYRTQTKLAAQMLLSHEVG